MIDEPQGAFMYRSSIIVDLADFGLFHRLLLTVWGPKVISMVAEPQGALTCQSSTITVLADSSPFLGLLLSFGVPK